LQSAYNPYQFYFDYKIFDKHSTGSERLQMTNNLELKMRQ
jgi:hypothetical protein